MGSWKSSDRPRRSADVAARRYEGKELVIVLPRAEQHVLSEVGSTVFEMLDGIHTVDQIIARLRAEYEVDEATARKDLFEFLDELESAGMLVAPDVATR